MKTYQVRMIAALVALMTGCVPPEENGALRVDAPLNEGTVGTIFQMRAREGRIDVTSEVSWEVSDSAVASVAGGGKLRLLAAGAVTVTAVLKGERASTEVKVRAVPMTALNVLPAIDRLSMGARQQFVVIASFADGLERDVTRAAIWSFEGGLSASGSAGSAVATHEGPAVVRASYAGQQARALITISPPARVGLHLELQSAIHTGELARMTLVASFLDGSKRDVSATTMWTSSHTEIAEIRVSSDGVFLHALRAGFTQVAAVFEGIKTTVPVSISDHGPAALEFDLAQLDLPAGTQRTVDVFARYPDGERVRLGARADYESAHPQVFTVDGDGTVTGLELGTSVLRVTFGGETAELTIDVLPARIVGITTSISKMRLAPGQSAELTVTGHFSDGATADLTATATAQTAGRATVKLGNGLVVRARTDVIGTDSMLVQAGGFETVVPIEISRVQVVALKLALISDEKQARATATARWADGLELDVTELAHWELKGDGAMTISDTAGSRGELSGASSSHMGVIAHYGNVSALLALP